MDNDKTDQDGPKISQVEKVSEFELDTSNANINNNSRNMGTM